MSTRFVPGTASADCPVSGNWLRRCFRAFVPLLLLLLALGPGAEQLPLAAAAKKSSSSAKRRASASKATVKKSGAAKPRAATKRTSARKTTTARKTTAKKSTKASRARSSKRRVATRSTRYRGQSSPSSERYKEIQEALQTAGYLESAPTGRWDESSVSAMKRFQVQHSIAATGKVNALSLIALGLGPKRGPAPGTSSVLEAAPDTPATESNERE